MLLVVEVDSPTRRLSEQCGWSRQVAEFAVVYFRDAASLRWTLLADGELAEVDPDESAGAPTIATAAVARARYLAPQLSHGDGDASQSA